MMKRFAIAIVAAASFLAAPVHAQGQPASWKYSIPPGDISTATYIGNVDIKGQLITGGSVMQFPTVAALQAAKIPASVTAVQTAGYFSPGDSGGAVYVSSVSAVTCSVTSADGKFWKLGPAPAVSVRQCGAVPDDGADDAAIIQSVVNSPLFPQVIVPPGNFEVSTMTWTISVKGVTFSRGAKLYGISTVPVDAILRLHNFRNARIDGMTIETDGAAVTPVYQQNYGTALQLTSDNGSSPTQFVYINGLTIRYIKAGITNGALLGQAPQASFPQSELYLNGYTMRGVMQGYYSNATNSYLTSTAAIYLSQQFEANSSWWSDAAAFNVRADVGDFVSIGEEYQSARALGYNIYGRGMRIIGPVWEHSCINYITGAVTITDMANGFFGNNALAPFVIDPAATGYLILDNINLRRPNGTASSSRSLFVDAKGNNNFRIEINNSYLKEWAYTVNSASAHFVLGGKFKARLMELDNSASTQPSWSLDMLPTTASKFDPTGFTMAVTPDTSAKGGWTATGAPAGAAFNKYTASLPADYTSAIQFVTTGTALTVTTPTGASGQPVIGGKNYTVRMMFKGIGATITNVAVNILWYDFAGVAIGTASSFAADKTRLTASGYDEWQALRIPAASPAGAAFAAVQVISGTTSNVALTGVTFQ